MTAIRSPILVAWEAMNLLNEIDGRAYGHDVDQRLVQAEAALVNLVVALRKDAESIAAQLPANLIQFAPRRLNHVEFAT
jgi:hypothetical protein